MIATFYWNVAHHPWQIHHHRIYQIFQELLALRSLQLKLVAKSVKQASQGKKMEVLEIFIKTNTYTIIIFGLVYDNYCFYLNSEWFIVVVSMPFYQSGTFVYILHTMLSSCSINITCSLTISFYVAYSEFVLLLPFKENNIS